MDFEKAMIVFIHIETAQKIIFFRYENSFHYCSVMRTRNDEVILQYLRRNFN